MVIMVYFVDLNFGGRNIAFSLPSGLVAPGPPSQRAALPVAAGSSAGG